MSQLGKCLCNFLDPKRRRNPAGITDETLKVSQGGGHTEVACIDGAVSDSQVSQSSQGVDEDKACIVEVFLS